MEIVTKTSTSHDGRSAAIVFVDGDMWFQFIEGEHEDNILGRNYSDVYEIGSALVRAYNLGFAAGKSGAVSSSKHTEKDVSWEKLLDV